MWTDGTHISNRPIHLQLCKKGLGADNEIPKIHFWAHIMSQHVQCNNQKANLI